MWLIDRHYWQRFDPTYQYCIPDCRVIKRIIRSYKYIGTLWERNELCPQFYSLEKEGRQLPWQKGSFPLHLEEARHVLDCDPIKSYPGSQENEQVASVTSPEQFIPPWGGEKIFSQGWARRLLQEFSAMSSFIQGQFRRIYYSSPKFPYCPFWPQLVNTCDCCKQPRTFISSILSSAVVIKALTSYCLICGREKKGQKAEAHQW